MNWLIVGITGVSCSGKSTLARSIIDRISKREINVPEHITIGSVQLIKQDDYFHPKTYSKHTWIPEFNYINREILSALNMEKMCDDLSNILGSGYKSYQRTEENLILNILIIEGFLIFNHQGIRDMCQIKLDIQLTYDECFKRRRNRIYNPPNPPGYFQKILWPFYLKHLNEYKAIDNLHVFNGELSEECCLSKALELIGNYL